MDAVPRRAVLLLPFAAAAAQAPQDLDAEFTHLANDFIGSWNLLLAAHIRGKWDVKLAGEVERAFRRLTEHPGWVRARK